MLRFWEHVVISLSIEMHVPCGIGDLSWSKISNDYTWYTVLVFFKFKCSEQFFEKLERIRNEWIKVSLHNKRIVPTCASVSPNMAASCRLSGFVTYFWTSNRFSSPFRWRLENTARDQDRFRLEWCPRVTSSFRIEYGPGILKKYVEIHSSTNIHFYIKFKSLIYINENIDQ